MIGPATKTLTALLLALLTSGAAVAQTTASVMGRVTDELGGPVPGATIEVRQGVAGLIATTTAGADGAFRLANVPPRALQILVGAVGFQSQHIQLDLREEPTAEVAVVLRVTADDQVTVSAPTPLMDATVTGTRVSVTAEAIDTLPRAAGSRGLEAVLVSLPGFAQNANGAIHPRGAHNQMTYVVDGLPISDQLTGAFANALDPALVQHVELLTGNIPAEFGNKVSGVAVITTKSGLGLGHPFSGDAAVEVGSFATRRLDLQGGGSRGHWGYFATGTVMSTDRFLDAVSRENHHNEGSSSRWFARIDHAGDGGALTRFHVMSGRADFELANLRSQQASSQNQRQALRDGAVWLVRGQRLGANGSLELVGAHRHVAADLIPSAGDRPVTAAQGRDLGTSFAAARVSTLTGAHGLRAGFEVLRFPVREEFSFGVTDPGFNAPESSGFNASLVPFDLTRGGSLFEFRQRASGRLVSAFAQDTWRMSGRTLTLGVRYDAYAFLVRGHQFQPRVGGSWSVWGDRAVLRGSYNRNYHVPPNENLLLSSSPVVARLAPTAVRQTFGDAPRAIRPERQDTFEVGVHAPLGRVATLDVAAYYKRSRDQQDNNNFLETGIIFPVTLAELTAKGVEFRFSLAERRGATATVSATVARAVATPPFTGGLFLGQEAIDALSAGPFLIDHDQRFALHVTGQQRFGRNWRLGGSLRHDSGLVANPSDPAIVAADADYFDLLEYVDLTATVPRVRPRTIADVMVSVEGGKARRRWRVRLQVTNLTNRTALYNFQSVFVGTRLVQPRSLSAQFQARW